LALESTVFHYINEDDIDLTDIIETVTDKFMCLPAFPLVKMM